MNLRAFSFDGRSTRVFLAAFDLHGLGKEGKYRHGEIGRAKDRIGDHQYMPQTARPLPQEGITS